MSRPSKQRVNIPISHMVKIEQNQNLNNPQTHLGNKHTWLLIALDLFRVFFRMLSAQFFFLLLFFPALKKFRAIKSQYMEQIQKRVISEENTQRSYNSPVRKSDCRSWIKSRIRSKCDITRQNLPTFENFVGSFVGHLIYRASKIRR